MQIFKSKDAVNVKQKLKQIAFSTVIISRSERRSTNLTILRAEEVYSVFRKELGSYTIQDTVDSNIIYL